MTRWSWWLVALGWLMIWLGPLQPAYAQLLGGGQNLPLALVLWILGQSATVSLVVTALKNNPWVRGHPKLTAAGLNVAVALAEIYFVNVLPGGALVTFLTALAAQFGASGFYENVIQPGLTIVMPPKT